MGADKPRWYDVGNGQLRYMDSEGWTDLYKAIDEPEATTPSAGSESSNPAHANEKRGVRRPSRRTLNLVIALSARRARPRRG
jgi:hypothetical protein